jgi:hypothetical protein
MSFVSLLYCWWLASVILPHKCTHTDAKQNHGQCLNFYSGSCITLSLSVSLCASMKLVSVLTAKASSWNMGFQTGTGCSASGDH